MLGCPLKAFRQATSVTVSLDSSVTLQSSLRLAWQTGIKLKVFECLQHYLGPARITCLTANKVFVV
jgi:hypothetical protein